MFIHGLMISFIISIKWKIFELSLDAKGQQNDGKTVVLMESSCSASISFAKVSLSETIPVPWLLLSLTCDL